MDKQIESQETEWEESDPEAVSAQLQEHEKEVAERNARTAQIKMDVPGDYTYRFLPPVKGQGGTWAFKTWIHYIKNPNKPDEKGRPVVCPSKTRDARCVVCEVVSALYRQSRTDAKAKDMAGQLRSKETYFANVVRVDTKDGMKAGPKILGLPQTVYEALSKIFKDPDKGGDFTHPKTGYKVIITRVGTKMDDTRYTVSLNIKQSPIESMDWLKHMHILSKHVGEMTTEDMSAILEGRQPEVATDVAPIATDRQLKSVSREREPGEDDDEDDDDRLIEDPLKPGEFETIRALRTMGRKV
jgi:gp32 DNA binding protein like